jgi:hypothetical protein
MKSQAFDHLHISRRNQTVIQEQKITFFYQPSALLLILHQMQGYTTNQSNSKPFAFMLSCASLQYYMTNVLLLKNLHQLTSEYFMKSFTW